MGEGICRDKAVLVTGAASGIGRATVLALAREGARVIAADRSAAGAAAVAEAVRAAGGEAIDVVADVAREDDVAAMVETAVRRFGRLDGAVNNAGIGGAETGSAGKRTAEIPRAAWDRIIAVNLTGVWLGMTHEIAAMQATGGAIVNVASVGGVVGLPTAAAYTASKHGVVGLTKAAAIEYGAAAIRINAVCPGYIETPLIQASLERRRGHLEQRTPLGRLGTAEEIAELVVWLCSDRAAYVTGAAYTIDGGYTAA
ncbi:SDR family NAD(P)-dependent oxidoreductase [Chelatococcus reniformis]|uniref:Short chain dehydrogenase n=1 Tax=Chelatococcus reniformis TaxID=1494448 RepID=A0A916XJH1_9HYPH|nr:SDR family oxidoreductase [Chelatococcus reniformis]GGC77965.1 short chain dehydrogenase [Chelatococcus reniformis]